MRHLKTVLVALAAAVVAGVGTVAIAGTIDQFTDRDTVALEAADDVTRTGDAVPGAADEDLSSRSTAETTPAPAPAATHNPTAADADLISREDAGAAAAAEVGAGAEVLRVQRDDDDGRAEFEVHLLNQARDGYEVHVDAADGTIREVERDDVGADDRRPVVEATVSRAEAERIALTETGGEEVVQASLEEDDHTAEWELDVRRSDGTWVEVTLDATDGTILEIDIDD